MSWNKSFERVLGYSAEEIARPGPLDLFGAGDREAVRARILEVFEEGASYVETEFLSKDGTRTPYPKPFIWAATANDILEKVKRGRRKLDKLHAV